MAPLLRCGVFVLLAISLTPVPVVAEGKGSVFQRQKREWIIAPRKLKENHDYTGLDSIARIRSDKEFDAKIFYYITGPGVDQPPLNVFSINHETGYVKVHTVLDREEHASYHLKGVAKYRNEQLAEKDIDLIIVVEDVNDNPPIVTAMQVGSVNESCAAGTFVMKVIATDADEANTPRSKIYYSIAEHSNAGGIFYINSETGEVRVRKTTLDREIKDTYKLIIEVADMNGQGGGNVGSGEVEIKILDINDNIPVLEKDSYEGSIEENTINVEVLRIKAIDMDLIHTDNWLAVYEIVSGNEAGYFTITTDSKTNEGVIMIQKSLDYEQLKVVDLKVAVHNKAEYNFGSVITPAAIPKSYPIKINVVNQKEGPRFQPSVKVVTISEDQSSVSINKIITTYAAIDSDTLQKATNVRYMKIRDDDNWLIIDEKTADIRLNKLPDRESTFLINGTYFAEIICITNDSPSKTATGTIAIQVEDFNDHCPELTATTHTMCFGDNVIYATASDKDEYPNGAPFEFTVIQEKSKGKWTVEHFNETTAILREHSNLWPGIHKVGVMVKDQQGKSCDDVQMMDVTVCTCIEDTKTCVARQTKTSEFGAAGILLLLLGLLLLLLVPLLLFFCLCGGAGGDFMQIPFETKQGLIQYHTEGQGEDKEVPLLQIPGDIHDGGIQTKDVYGVKSGFVDAEGVVSGGAGFGSYIHNTSTLTKDKNWFNNQYVYSAGHGMGTGLMTGEEHIISHHRAGVFDGMALSDHFLEEYYSSKSDHAAQLSQQKDALLIYDYEGQESLAGSVGCCSLLENDDDLAFLDDLGPKFKTLAEICQGSTLITESVDARVSVPTIRPVSPLRPSTSSHTHVHTHTETIRDRDRSTIDTSNVASGSSTLIREERITERAQGSATVPTVHVQENVVNPSQTLLIQQPALYYAATPMYVVESQPQMVLVAGGAQQQSVGQVSQVGLSQGLVQVGGLQASQGVVLVDRQVGMSGVTGQVGMCGVTGQVGMSGVAGQVAQGLSQGTVSRSRKVLVVENGSSGGEHGEQLAQGFFQVGQGSAEQALGVRGQGMQMKAESFSLGSQGSVGSNEDTPEIQGNQRVVVQHKKVVVTERNFESSSRA